jgi:hypothetical protein
MDRFRRRLRAHGLNTDQGDRAQQRDAGAVELQERQPAQDHAQIDYAKDDKNDRCHDGIRQLPFSNFTARPHRCANAESGMRPANTTAVR